MLRRAPVNYQTVSIDLFIGCMFWFPKRGPRGIGPLDMTNIGKTKHSSERGLLEYKKKFQQNMQASQLQLSFFFLDFFTAKKSYPVLLSHFTDRNDRFPYPFIHFDQQNSYTRRLREVPLLGGASPVQVVLPPAPGKRLTQSLLMMPLLTIKLMD